MLCHSSMSVCSAPSIESELVLKKCWWFHVLRKAWFTTGLSLYFSSSLCFSVCIRNSSTEGKRSCGRKGGWQYLMYTLQTVGDCFGSARERETTHSTRPASCTAQPLCHGTAQRKGPWGAPAGHHCPVHHLPLKNKWEIIHTKPQSPNGCSM